MPQNGMVYPTNCNTWNAKLGYNASYTAPVAQLDRVGGFEPLGRGFESLRVHQINNPQPQAGGFLFASPGRLVRTPVRQNADAFWTRSNATQPVGLFPQSGKNQSLRVGYLLVPTAVSE